MTVTEFARKYNVPVGTVYQAHFRIPYERRKNVEDGYSEADLFMVTVEELKNSIEYHTAKLKKSKERLLNMKNLKELRK